MKWLPVYWYVVGSGWIFLAVCMALSSLSDNAVFQIAACWTLPLAYVGGTPGFNGCIKLVRLHTPPVASVAVVEATTAPSTNKSKASLLRLNAMECQFPSKAVPPAIGVPMGIKLYPRALPAARCGCLFLSLPMCA